jgi:hypothetical protein
MSDILPVRFPTGEVIWVRVTSPTGIRDTAAPSHTEMLESEGFAETIATVAGNVRRGLGKVKPSEVRVEFGLEFTAQTGHLLSVLAQGGGSASVRVELTWSSDNDDQAPSPPALYALSGPLSHATEDLAVQDGEPAVFLGGPRQPALADAL